MYVCPGGKSPKFFEKAAITAALETIPNVEVHGCFFHLCQNIFRKVQTSGLQERYQKDEAFSLSVRIIGASHWPTLLKPSNPSVILYLRSCQELRTRGHLAKDERNSSSDWFS